MVGDVDGLTPAQREDAIEGHRTSEKDPGFIARYRYKFTVTMPDKTTVIDDQKNGEYRVLTYDAVTSSD